MPGATPEAIAQENEDLRRKLKETESRALALLEIFQRTRDRHALETSLAWIILIAMAVANGLAFAWAR